MAPTPTDDGWLEEPVRSERQRRRDPVRDAHLPIDPDLAPDDPAEPATDHVVARRRTRPAPRRFDGAVLAAIALGGALGASARYGVAQLVEVGDGAFPWATFWTNVTGSFALGLVLVVILERFPPTRFVRPFLATGFLGAYTTYSTFAVETDVLVKDGHAAVAVAYALTSMVVGFLAVWAGICAARFVARSARHTAGEVRS
jgi:CrcB protein